MSGISSRIGNSPFVPLSLSWSRPYSNRLQHPSIPCTSILDKGQTRFAPKLKARPNRSNKGSASEDGATATPTPTPTSTPTPSIGGSEAGTFPSSSQAAVAAATTLSTPNPTPVSTQTSELGSTTASAPGTQTSITAVDISAPSSSSSSTGTTSITTGKDSLSRRLSAATISTPPPTASSSAPKSPTFSPSKSSVAKEKSSQNAGISISFPSSSSSSSPSTSPSTSRSGAAGTAITAPGVQSSQPSKSQSSGSIISVPSSRTRAVREETEIEEDYQEGGSSQHPQPRKRTKSKHVASQSSTSRGKQPIRQRYGDDEEEANGAEGEEELDEDAVPDYSNTRMFEFVKDMGVGRRSALFIEQQKQLDEKRRLALQERQVLLDAERDGSTPPSGYGMYAELDPGQGSQYSKKEEAKSEQSTPNMASAPKTFAPQVRIVDGRIELDLDSLTVDHAVVEGGENQGPMEYVEESASTKFINSATYSKKSKSERWSEADTELFYKALSQWGTDFGIIYKMFPGKNRIAIRNKFKREDRLNHSRVEAALNRKLPIDLGQYSEITNTTFPEISEQEEAIKKISAEESEQLLEPLENAEYEDEMAGQNEDDEEIVSEMPAEDEEEIVGMI
ncbi:Transcription factor TFIIIB component B [Lunasporangiospora selenospora]|uniref:Transcription factor TFIIIB component B n=1 Tax=Lunasporangiospora selenospora TaxID=979761 RepID=A0A9P6KBR3_9FUNG|nr:Transcription factor TFIIIB component B [Lunasporangiospora selenospora]